MENQLFMDANPTDRAQMIRDNADSVESRKYSEKAAN